jgi:hypothetical protein
MKRKKPIIMIASTVYGFERDLEQICATLRAFGYEVWNSHIGTLPVYPNMSALDSCIRAVSECDLFLSIIRPFYGSGIEEKGGLSITHREILKAIELDKLRWCLAHHHVVFARKILKQYMFDENEAPIPSFKFKKCSVMDDIKVIKMYNDAVRDDIPIEKRTGNWVHEFTKIDNILEFISAQFADIKRVKNTFIISKTTLL